MLDQVARSGERNIDFRGIMSSPCDSSSWVGVIFCDRALVSSAQLTPHRNDQAGAKFALVRDVTSSRAVHFQYWLSHVQKILVKHGRGRGAIRLRQRWKLDSFKSMCYPSQIRPQKEPSQRNQVEYGSSLPSESGGTFKTLLKRRGSRRRLRDGSSWRVYNTA